MKILPHRVQILARCVRILTHFVHILAHFVQILAHWGQMVPHCVKMLARDLGELLIGHRQDTQSGSMGTHRRSKQRQRSSESRPWSPNEPRRESNGRLPSYTSPTGPFTPSPS